MHRARGAHWGRVVNVLRSHVGHRCWLKDDRHLRCVDCDVTLVLAPVGPVLPSDADRCPRHVGEPEDNCGRCRADQLEALGPPPPRQRPATDAGIKRARELFEAAKRKEDT